MPDGPRADLMRHSLKYESAAYGTKLNIEIPPPTNFEFNYDLYVVPWFMVGELQESIAGFQTGFIAYGLSKFIPLAEVAGAIDFLCEPWELHELAYRCNRAIGERAKDLSWGLVIANGKQSHINGVALKLTRGQHLLFQLLVANAGKVMTYEIIHKVLCIHNSHSRVLSVYASELRQQIAGFVGYDPEAILINCYGQGYLLQA